MDMYGGNPPHFYLQGMSGTPRIASYAQDAENYVYRGLMATVVVAKAFGDAQLVEVLYGFLAKYESVNNHLAAGAREDGALHLSKTRKDV